MTNPWITEKGETAIFVCDRGFVIVGRATIDPHLAFHWLLKPGRTIRRWGTTNGLTELKDGPTSNTVLDKPAIQHIPFRAVLNIIEVDQNKWKLYLS